LTRENINLGQAIYGERGGAHTLVARSDGPGPFATATAYTDLPSTLPPGIAWLPFERVFRLREQQDSLVISRTFPDQEAPRAGMVATHALFVPLEDALRVSDLTRFTSRLAMEPPMSTQLMGATRTSGATGLLPTLTVDIGDGAEPDAHGSDVDITATAGSRAALGPLGTRGRVLARALLETRPGRPVVWVGQEGFWEAVCLVWRVLSPEARRTFAARLSFGPPDVEGLSLTLVCTPEALAPRWPADTFRIVGREPNTADTGDATSPAEALLAGEPGGAALALLARELEAPLARIRDLRLLEETLVYLETPARSADATRALARLLAQLSPDPAAGIAHKRSVVDELAHLTRSGSALDVLALANFGTASAAFAGAGAVFDAVEHWIKAQAVPATLGVHVDVAGVTALLTRAFDVPSAASSGSTASEVNSAAARSGRSPQLPGTHAGSSAVEPWRVAVRRGIDALLEPTPLAADAASAVWKWWRAAPPLVTALASSAAAGSAVDQALAAAAPPTAEADIDAHLGAIVARAASARGWARVHAIGVAASLTPAEAIRAQLAFTAAAPDADAGLREVAERVPAAALIAAAVAEPAPAVVALAGAAVARTPTLLKGLDVTDPGWRAVWTAALSAGLSPWRGVRDPETVATALANATLTPGAPARAVTDALWVALAVARETDMTGYPRRAALWDALGTAARKALLAETAQRWLENFGTDPDVWVPRAASLEPPLAREIAVSTHLREALAAWRSHSDGGARAVGELFAAVPTLSEAQYREALRSVASAGHIPAASMRILGIAAARRRWNGAASELADLALHRGDFLPAARECLELLGFFQSLRIRLAGATTERPDEDEAWNALFELACQLYQSGPTESYLWERAGGDPSELEAHGTGRDRWRDALRRLRYAGTHATASSLLRQMRKDFAHNQELAFVANLEQFRNRGRHHDHGGRG
jgi:hypothetical protein